MANNYDMETRFPAEILNRSAAACSFEPLQLEGLGFTPLHAAVQSGDRAQVERVLADTGAADLDTPDAAGRTSLLLAVAFRAPELVQLLLQHGADPSIADHGGRTPLHVAAERGCLQGVRLLLGLGDIVKVSARDKAGLTPLGVARSEVCVRELVAADGALSPNDLSLLLRDRPDKLRQLLDQSVQPDSKGGLRVTYRALRDVGRDCPFEAELVRKVQRSGCRQMLSHPAIELLLVVTWQDTLWMAVTSLVFTVVFLAVLSAVVMLDVYHVGEPNKEILKKVLLTLNCARILVQLMELFFAGAHVRSVIRKLRFWPKVATTVLTFLVVLLARSEAKRAVNAAVILSGFLELTLAVESIPKWNATKAISSLLHVTHKIVGYLLTYLPILVGFGLSFFVLLRDKYWKKSAFRGSILTMTIAAMVIGNVEVEDVKDHAPEPKLAFVVCNIIFILFLVLVPLVMLNMLLALTIDDTRKFLSNSGSEYLHHVANMTVVNQRAAFSLDRRFQTLHDKVPGWLFSCVSSLTLCVKGRSALPRHFETDGSSCITLVVDPVTNGKTARVTTWGSKRCYRVNKDLCDRLRALTGDKEEEVSQQLQTMREEMTQQQHVMREMVKQLNTMREEMTQQQHAMREEMTQQQHVMREMVKQLDTMPERLGKSV